MSQSPNPAMPQQVAYLLALATKSLSAGRPGDAIVPLRDAALLDAQVVRRFWQEHLDGSRNWQYLLWDVLMLEAWREHWA